MARLASFSKTWLPALALLASLCGGCSARGAGPCDAPLACGECGPKPAEAKPGEAWCCVWVPPVEGTVEERVCVKPAGTRCAWVPPTYGTRQRLVCDEGPRIVERLQPAEYCVKRQQVVVQPEGTRTRCVKEPGCGPCQPSTVREVTEKVPAVVQEQCTRIAVRPDRLALEYTPATYRVLEERYEISPGFTEQVEEPAQWATVTRKVVLQPGRWEWRLNPTCTVPVAPPAPVPAPVACAPAPPREVPLHALELEMIDLQPDGDRKGVFKVGSLIRYEVRVASDGAEGAMEGLRMVFDLPPELEYVSGGGASGLRVQGTAQQARTSEFSLSGEQSLELHIVARVKSAPPTELLQVAARVEDRSGETLAWETESSTVPSLP
ncbi:MAG: hypothetical protein ACKOSS_01400 [Planctomycetia bacterium]